jgi:FdhD protein
MHAPGPPATVDAEAVAATGTGNGTSASARNDAENAAAVTAAAPTRPTARDQAIEVHAPGARPRRATWAIAAESAVEIDVNGAPFAVTMATPADLVDLALGFALSERLLASPRAFTSATVRDTLEGLIVDLQVDAAAVDLRARDARRLEGRSGCGLCGIDSLASFAARLPASVAAAPAVADTAPSTRAAAPDDAAVLAALAGLRARQPLNARTHSVHAAAWCAPDGGIRVVREDVGRHNALDKVIGALARDGRLGEPGFVALTSRLSFELVYKAAAAGAACVATVSAPTTLALDVADRIALPVCCLGPGGALVRFP